MSKNEPFIMFKVIPSTEVPGSVPALEDVCPSAQRDDGRVPPFPKKEDVPPGRSGVTFNCRSEIPRKNVEARWLSILGRSFGTCVRIIDPENEPNVTGGGTVCRALDAFCGWRSGCNHVHGAIHRNSSESGCVQHVRCPLGFSLVSVPVRAKGMRIGQLEFGPFGVDQIDRAAFERGLRQLGLPQARYSSLQASLGEVRIVRAEDLEGVVALVERVAVEIGDETVRVPGNVEVREPAAVVAGRRYAELNIGGRISLAEVARHVALSPDHFSRLFRTTTGLSFGSYVNHCRVAKAQRLLVESSLRVAEISYACGFDSVPHFNRVFRRHSRTSPTCYRRQVRSQQRA